MNSVAQYVPDIGRLGEKLTLSFDRVLISVNRSSGVIRQRRAATLDLGSYDSYRFIPVHGSSSPNASLRRLALPWRLEGVKATLNVVLLGVVMGPVCQLRVLGRFYSGEALGFALLLGFVPYLLIRGPADRFVRWLSAHRRLQ
jgi:hypothetical protein